ncbi:MAG: GerMN domain-containing protein [Spirochaetota bacterium]
MVKTNDNEKRKLKKSSNKNGNTAKGFKNGKLYRGATGKKTSNKLTSRSTKKDYKNKKSYNNDKKTTNSTTKKTNKLNIKSTIISITMVVFAIGSAAFIINLMLKTLNSEINPDDSNSISDTNDIRDEHLQQNDELSRIDDTGENGEMVVEAEDDSINIPELTVNEEDINNEIEDTDMNEIEDTDMNEIEPDELDEPNNEDTDDITNIDSEAAVFFYAKRDGAYGLVGFPLTNEIKSKPLEDKIKLLVSKLLNTPDYDGAMTMIPDNTKFLGFRLVQDTLYLNFNDSFNYNNYGVEGDILQLAQIIYTFTSLEDINKVSFLINGKYPSSIGSHGLENKEWTEKEIGKLL